MNRINWGMIEVILGILTFGLMVLLDWDKIMDRVQGFPALAWLAGRIGLIAKGFKRHWKKFLSILVLMLLGLFCWHLVLGDWLKVALAGIGVASLLTVGFLSSRLFKISPPAFEKASRDTTLGLQTFIVYAHLEDGIDTGLSLQPDQRVRIVATGEVSIDEGKTWMYPSGVMSRGPNEGKRFRHPGTHLDDQDGHGIIGALIGWIGEDREKSSFLIGEKCTRTIDRSGNLHLGINDTRGAYRDNIDQCGRPTFFTVYVEVLR